MKIAVTFNAMGLHPQTRIDNKLCGQNSKIARIDAYIIKGDIVNKGQFFKADGTKHFLKPTTSPEIKGLLDVFISSSGVYYHSMNRFLEYYNLK